jgi:hypothetical protein
MRSLGRGTAIAAGLLLVGTLASMPAGADGRHHDEDLRTVVDGLDGPRGVDTLGHGRTLVSESDGSFSLVIERRDHAPKVIELGAIEGGFAPAIAAGRHGRVYILAGAGGEPGGPPVPGSATLYEWRHGYDAPVPVFDVAAYQVGDPDPANLEGPPEESNPFGLAALRDGSLLIADAAGNDLIRWWPHRHPVTVARLLPRVVDVPDGLPLPADEVPAEAVATSVAVGPDGYWYVGELRGFPATPGTSQVWRIKPGSVDAVCDPEAPWNRTCKRYADGLTSIVDLGADHRSLYAVSLSKAGWLAAEAEDAPPADLVGGLFKIKRHHHHTWVREIAAGELVLPGGVDAKHDVYVTGPVFGTGTLSKTD